MVMMALLLLGILAKPISLASPSLRTAFLIAQHPETPVFAVTQDIYVHRRVAALLNKAGLTERPSAGGPPPSRVRVGLSHFAKRDDAVQRPSSEQVGAKGLIAPEKPPILRRD